MYSHLSPEQRVPAEHPLRPIRKMTDEALRGLSRKFSGMYSETGRPSIPPEKLLRALLLQVLYTVRSERLLMEQLEYNLLFRWFVGLKQPLQRHSCSSKSGTQENRCGIPAFGRLFIMRPNWSAATLPVWGHTRSGVPILPGASRWAGVPLRPRKSRATVI